MEPITQRLNIVDLTPHVSITKSEDNVARGGVADVRRATFTKARSFVQPVAVKSIRVDLYGPANAKLLDKLQKKLYRELEIWKTLQAEAPHPNILPLLGVIESALEEGPTKFVLPSSVSELCMGNLAEYMTMPAARSRRIQLVIDTLEGLSHMHKLKIVHGDLKAPNILVTDAGTAKICDFGHSRFVNTTPSQADVSDVSSKFQSTTRYMSPELFSNSVTRPSLASDIWAFGCVALEILSKLRPYHLIASEHRVPAAIIQGKVPSIKPEHPHAAGCLNDILWDLVKTCWHMDQRSRPTAADLLKAIKDLIHRGAIPINTLTPTPPTMDFGPEIVRWPDDVHDFSEEFANYSKERISCRRMADIWIYRAKGDSEPAFLAKDERHSFKTPQNDARLTRVIVKVPRLPSGLSVSAPEYDQFQRILRLAVKERFSLQHNNLVGLVGLDNSYGRYPGLVLEYCSYGDLTLYKKLLIPNEKDFEKYMKQILQGLQYLHSLPSALSHGDLTPENVFVDGQGTLKLSIISFARLTANLPATTQTGVPVDDAISARYISPELLLDEARPTPESDMWSFGCVAFWIFTDLPPYADLRREYEIVEAIEGGKLPHGMNTITEIEELGSHLIMGATSPWITNGTLSHILRCWDPRAKSRPNAADVLKHLDQLPESELVEWRPPAGFPDLTGSVQTPGERNRPILGWSVGTWRRIYDGRSRNRDEITIKLWWWRGIYSAGFFRRNTDVIIKSVRSDMGEYLEPAQQVFRHELVLLNQLKHDNILSIMGFNANFIDPGRSKVPALVTEYCSNGKLREYCQRNHETLSETDRMRLIRGMASAVDYIHDRLPEGSVVHGILSMDSVMVDKNGVPKLANFEFGCQYQHSDNPLLAAILMAPPLAPNPTRWDAPELFQDVSDSRAPFPTRYTDLWSLGCLITFVFCCKLPYPDSELPGAIARIMNAEKPYPQDVCPRKIWDLADKLWERVPYGRISASKVIEMIDELSTPSHN